MSNSQIAPAIDQWNTDGGDQAALAPGPETPLPINILVLENVVGISIRMADALRSGDYVAVPVATPQEALALLDDQHFAAAVLDMKRQGDSALNLAATLTERNVPFVFYGGAGKHPAPYQDIQVIDRPFTNDTLLGAIAGVLGAR